MKPASRLRLNTREAGGVLVIEVIGDLVLDLESRLLREEVDRLLEAGYRKILLNLGQMRYLDSMGAGVLAVIRSSAIRHDAHVKLCCANPLAYQVLSRLKLTEILDLHPDEPAALESFR